MSKHLLACLMVFGATICAASPADARAGAWQWIRLAPDAAGGWEVRRATAEVRMRDGRLHAALSDNSSYVVFELDGTVNATGASVVERQLGTDATPRRFVGLIEHVRTKQSDPSNGWGSDRVTLRYATYYLGLYRTLSPP